MSKPILLVVESPAKCKTISKHLGPNYIIRATVGHVVDLASKGTKHNLGVDIDNDFKPIYKVIPDKKDKIAAIIDAAKQSSLILLASDEDREGEAISVHVLDQLKKHKIKVPTKRITFNEITKAALVKAIESPREVDYNLYDAQQARRVLDRIVGFMVSPYLMNLMGEDSLSAGRVQSVCLRLITDREKEIEAFNPEAYWNISAALAKSKDKLVAKYPNKVTDEKTAKKIKKDLDASAFVITKVEGKEQVRNPPPPLTTSKMQQLSSARYKFGASQTMRIAQQLYEAGHVSYIRSDSLRCSPESIKSVRDWITGSGFDIPARANVYKNKDSSQDAHEAIRPSNVAVTPDEFFGDENQCRVYKLIWENFVASQMKPAVYDTVSLSIDASEGHELKAAGRTLKYKGWLAVGREEKRSDDVTLPEMKKGDKLKLIAPKVKSVRQETKPPPRFTEGTLVKELERKKIGRPSTFAAIISKIVARNYVKQTKNLLEPTDLGSRVVDTLKEYFSFMEYKYTADMEGKLDKIAEGKLDYTSMLEGFFEPFKKELKEARKDTYIDGGRDCDFCGQRMILKHSKYGYFLSCSDYPECKRAIGCVIEGDVSSGDYKIILNEKHQVVEGETCPKCSAGMVRRDGKFGPFYSCSKYPQCKGSGKVLFGKKCSKCKKGELYMTVFGGEPKLACIEYPNCRNIENMPAGSSPDWVDPKKIMPKQDKKVENILNKK